MSKRRCRMAREQSKHGYAFDANIDKRKSERQAMRVRAEEERTAKSRKQLRKPLHRQRKIGPLPYNLVESTARAGGCLVGELPPLHHHHRHLIGG